MKTNILYIFAVVLVMVLVGCKSEKKSDYIIVDSEPVEEKQVGPIAADDYQLTDTVTWHGKVYTYTVSRECDKVATVAEDEDGQKFYDNKVSISIMRADNTEFYSHVFRKSSFSQYIPSTFEKGSILEGVVFEKAEADYLQFAASIAYPQTDEYIPFAVRISLSGNLTIVKITQLEERLE